MVLMVTSGEYLPPLPQELPAEAFERLDAVYGIESTAEQRAAIGEAAYLLIDGMHCQEAQPNASNVRQRLDRLINLLEEGSSARADDLIEVVGGLLDHDIVGEALGSLLTPAYRNDPHLRTLSPPALEERRLTLLAATKALQSNLHSTYAARRGANADLYKDRFIQRMDEIAEKAGLKRSHAYSHERENRQTPFVRWVTHAANEALQAFAPEVLSAEDQTDLIRRAMLQKLRNSFSSSAFEARIRIARDLNARALRTANSSRHAAKNRTTRA